MVKTRKEVLDFLRTEKSNLEYRFGILEIGLFGSFSREEQTESSDIDILVEFKEGFKNFDNYMDLKFFLEEVFGRKVDLIIKSAVKPALRKYIEEELLIA